MMWRIIKYVIHTKCIKHVVKCIVVNVRNYLLYVKYYYY